MKVLILAPHPYFQTRGTPIAVDLLVRALSERGDKVDLLTFHEGIDRSYNGVRIFRIRPFFKITGIRPGFSFKKLYCDLHLFFRFILLMKKTSYDIVHAVEESAFMAMVICFLKSKPYIYDMDSSMSSQLVNKIRILKPLTKFLRWLESFPIRHAFAVLPMCEELAKDALQLGAKKVLVLKDISLIQLEGGKNVESLKKDLVLPKKIVMYIGNLESYQGIDLMLESFALVCSKIDELDLVIIGGVERDICKYKAKAQLLDVGERVHFLGQKPVEDLDKYMVQANILISPRIEGVNTPMKIYSYLDSGVPVLATDLPTHTQVMDSSIAMLAPPEKKSFAQAMIRLIEDESLGALLAKEAKNFIEIHHSYYSFKQTVNQLYGQLEKQVLN